MQNLKPQTKIIAVAALTVGIVAITLKAEANTQDPSNTTNQIINGQNIVPGRTPTTSQVADLGLKTVNNNTQQGGSQYTPMNSVNNQINGFVNEITGFINNDILGTINGLISSTIGAIQIPDFGEIVNLIMGGATSSNPATILSEKLEAKSGSSASGSYGVMDDYSKQAQRTAAVNTANATNLSTEAQAQSAEVLEATRLGTETNIGLANDSQSQDVTQRILQNLSQQTALNAQTNERILTETQKAGNNGAISNVLAAQTAKEASEKNTSERRQDISAGNQASQQSSMLTMPGGYTLNNQESSNNNWFKQ
jgi:hypothetical protein